VNTILTTLIGIGAGILKHWISNAMENSLRKHEMWMESKGMDIKDRRRAAKLQGVSFTRRFIAISFVCSLVIAPTIYAFTYPNASITIPVPSKDYGLLAMLLPWTEPIQNIRYTQVPVMAFVISLYDMFALIIGFYFGSGGSKIR